MIALARAAECLADFGWGRVIGTEALRRLWCGMNGHVTRSVVSALTAALPGCEIDSESHPTGGTWRTHPNYTVINTMFTTGTYIPFGTD